MITVYTQPDCLPCKRVIEKLTEANVDIEVVDLSKDLLAKDYVTRALMATSTPIIEVDNEYPIVGYQPEKVKEIIERFGNGIK